MDPGCVRAVEKLKEQIPKTVGEVRQLAGILSYYRRHIKNFAKIARPIYNLLSTSGKDGISPKTPVCWGREQQQALDDLIRHLSNPTIMAYPYFSKSFTLHTDASKDVLGAVLYQNQDGVMKVIAYGSRALSPAPCRQTSVPGFELGGGHRPFSRLSLLLSKVYCLHG